jgi:hypothetical protein
VCLIRSRNCLPFANTRCHPSYLVGPLLLIFLWFFLCCPIMCLYVLNSVWWCPLRWLVRHCLQLSQFIKLIALTLKLKWSKFWMKVLAYEQFIRKCLSSSNSSDRHIQHLRSFTGICGRTFRPVSMSSDKDPLRNRAVTRRTDLGSCILTHSMSWFINVRFYFPN